MTKEIRIEKSQYYASPYATRVPSLSALLGNNHFHPSGTRSGSNPVPFPSVNAGDFLDLGARACTARTRVQGKGQA